MLLEELKDSDFFQAYLQAIRNNKGDLRIALADSSKQLAPQTGPRVVQHTTRSNKVVDTEKTLERSELKANGQIITEKKKTIEHEEVDKDPIIFYHFPKYFLLICSLIHKDTIKFSFFQLHSRIHVHSFIHSFNLSILSNFLVSSFFLRFLSECF